MTTRNIQHAQALAAIAHEVVTGYRESCGGCGGDIGLSDNFPWHMDAEDCRAIREPVNIDQSWQYTLPDKYQEG